MYGTYTRLNVSVAASSLDVIRAVRKKLRKEILYDRTARHRRHKIYRAVLAEHASAQRLYNIIQRGI